MKGQKSFSLVLLLAEVAFTLFISGIAVPSLLRSDLATKEALAAGSLRSFNIAGFAVSYTAQNVALAILGGLVGSMTAFAIHFHATTPGNTPSTRTTTLQAIHHASPLTGLAETVNRDSASVGQSPQLPRHLPICLNLKLGSRHNRESPIGGAGFADMNNGWP
jgi:hypothetical protein